jgi:hypothetical protein
MRPSTETHPTQISPPTIADLLHDAYQAGLGLPDITPFPEVTAYVADRYERYTSTEPQNPGSFREYRMTRKLERVLDSIADTVEQRFRDEPAFADSFKDGTFPLVLARAFDNIETIHGQNVDLRNERQVDGRNDGDIYIKETTFTVADGSTELLNTIFTKLLHKNIPRDKKHQGDVHQPIVVADEGTDDILPTIRIKNVSEHDIRALGRAVDAGVWKWFRNQGVRTPTQTQKMSLANWERKGHTFPPLSHVDIFMDGVDEKYQNTTATANYNEKYAKDSLGPIKREQPLGTDSSGIFQRWRNIINGLGHHIRGGTSAHNLEQNPNRYDRLSLEEGIELRRATITKEQATHGPGAPRVLTNAEAAAEALKQLLEEAKKDTFGTAIKAARAAIGFGVVDLALAVTAKLPTGVKLTGELSRDAAEYREQQRKFALGRVALRNIVWKEIMGPRLTVLSAPQTEHAIPANTQTS